MGPCQWWSRCLGRSGTSSRRGRQQAVEFAGELWTDVAYGHRLHTRSCFGSTCRRRLADATLPSFAKLSGYRKQRGLYVKLIRKGTQWRGRVEGPIPRSAARGAILEEPAEGHGAALVSAAELPREDVLRRLRFRQGLPLRDAIGHAQEPEDDEKPAGRRSAWSCKVVYAAEPVQAQVGAP